MSILTRLADRHLDDAALAELWTNAAAEGADAVRHPHLDGCAECRVKLASFDQWMESLRLDAVAEADEIFTADRLNAQQSQILRRLEVAERPTRIIAFPKAHVAARRPSSVRRWITASAAAGLITGVALGQLMDLRHLSEGRAVPSQEFVEATRPASPAVMPASWNEETALAELEAIANPRYEALSAYDTFTPRAADYILPR